MRKNLATNHQFSNYLTINRQGGTCKIERGLAPEKARTHRPKFYAHSIRFGMYKKCKQGQPARGGRERESRINRKRRKTVLDLLLPNKKDNTFFVTK